MFSTPRYDPTGVESSLTGLEVVAQPTAPLTASRNEVDQ